MSSRGQEKRRDFWTNLNESAFKLVLPAVTLYLGMLGGWQRLPQFTNSLDAVEWGPTIVSAVAVAGVLSPFLIRPFAGWREQVLNRQIARG